MIRQAGGQKVILDPFHESPLACIPHSMVDLPQVRFVGSHAVMQVKCQAGEHHHINCNQGDQNQTITIQISPGGFYSGGAGTKIV